MKNFILFLALCLITTLANGASSTLRVDGIEATKVTTLNGNTVYSGRGTVSMDDPNNLLKNGRFTAEAYLDNWTVVTGSADISYVTIGGKNVLQVSCDTVGGCELTQDFPVSSMDQGKSLLLSMRVKTTSSTQGLTICYRENAVNTSICSAPTFNSMAATEAVIGSSATSAGMSVKISYLASPVALNADEAKMIYGTAVTNQPAVGPEFTWTPVTQGLGTISPSTNSCKGQQIGSNLKFSCNFTLGVRTGVEARIGLPSGLTVASITPSIQSVGSAGWGGGTFTGSYNVLVSSGQDYFKYSASTNTSGLTPCNGNGCFTDSTTVSFYGLIPIAQYASSVPTYTGRCNDKKNCSTVLAFSRSTANAISNISPASSTFSPTCTGTSTITCDLTSGNFTVNPFCQAFTTDTGLALGVVYQARSISTTSVTFNLTNTVGGASNLAVRVYCDRQGSDFDNAFTLQQNVALKNYSKTEITSGSGTDDFMVSYGGASPTTSCVSSPCASVNVIGSGVVNNVTVSGTTYTMNLLKTYSRLMCTSNHFSSTGSPAYSLSAGVIHCSNCSSVSFATATSTGSAYSNTYGVLSCKGQY